VDDTPANLDVLVGLLQPDFDLTVANRGAKALRLCETVPDIDLVLLDVMMPEMDGYEVCRQLRARPETATLPIIFITAKTGLDDIVRGFELGANDYVSKPFRPAELLARVRTQIALRSQQAEIEKKNEELQSLVHILCHDVANKFAVVRLVLDLLAVRPDLNFDAFRARIALAVDNGIGLTQLVRELRSTETKGLPLSPVSLRAAVDDVAALLVERLARKEIQLHTAIHDCAVLAEPWSLRSSVLENLLTNAIKFSPRGTRIELHTEPPTADSVVLVLRDHGIGMPAEMLATLFAIQKNASRPGTDGERGTGFGMPLVQRSVQLYGGRITVTSTELSATSPASGTEFRITFRLAPPASGTS
jgi:signal transduction histidine kinase